MSPAHTVARLMTISHAEFRRSLAPLAALYPYRIDASGRGIKLQDGENQIEIRLGEEQRIRLAALELPQTCVEFVFHAGDAEAIAAFFARFDLAFRRGGG